jgi:fibronectin-binding autotransporter adhesin
MTRSNAVRVIRSRPARWQASVRAPGRQSPAVISRWEPILASNSAVRASGRTQLSETQAVRGGFFAGFQRGDYQTTGVNSTDLPGTGESNVQVDAPVFGVYGSFNGRGGSYIDVSLVAQLPTATITVADGFHQRIAGQNVTLSTQLGHRFALGSGWTVEPQMQLSASTMEWGDSQIDASGKELVLDDDTLGTARASVNIERVFETAGGARVRPWVTVGVQDTLGEKQEAFSVMLPGSSMGSQAFPSHELGLTATLDAGLEADLSKSASLFGVVSYGESLRGSESEQLQANVGIRMRW